MSMDLYLWKAPVTGDEEEARKLVDRYFAANEHGVFEPSPDIAAVADELRRLHPYWPVSGEELLAAMSEEERSQYTEEGLAELRESGSFDQPEDGPWSDLPFEETDNLLVLNIRWSADNEVLDDIVRLGREHELVIYDPQGPSVYLPDDPVEDAPDEPPSLRDHASIWAMTLGLAGLTYLAWLIPIGWLRWPAVAVGAFLTIASLVVLFACLAGSFGWLKDEGRG